MIHDLIWFRLSIVELLIELSLAFQLPIDRILPKVKAFSVHKDTLNAMKKSGFIVEMPVEQYLKVELKEQIIESGVGGDSRLSWFVHVIQDGRPIEFSLKVHDVGVALTFQLHENAYKQLDASKPSDLSKFMGDFRGKSKTITDAPSESFGDFKVIGDSSSATRTFTELPSAVKNMSISEYEKQRADILKSLKDSLET